jgi:hypothetical protein
VSARFAGRVTAGGAATRGVAESGSRKGAIGLNWKAAIGLAALCVVSGCSLFSPFADPRQPRPGLLRDARGVPIKNSNGDVQPTFVSVAQAREYARALQDAYRRKVREQSTLRQVNNSALIALASSAIGVAATGGASSAAAALGISGAGVGAIGQQLVVAIQRQIYTQGGAALECIIGAASRTPEPAGNARATQALAGVLSTLGPAKVAYMNALPLLSQCPDPSESGDANAVLTGIWRLLDDSERYALQLQSALETVDGRGQILLSAVEAVRWRVDDELVKSEPDLLAFDNALRQSLESASASYRSAPAAPAAPAAPPAVPAEAKNALSPFATCPALYDAVTAAQVNAQALAVAVGRATQAMSAVETAAPYDPSLFSNCSLTNPIGIGALRAEPSETSIGAGSDATLQTMVRGGRAPYSVPDGTLPTGVAVQAGPAISDGQIYTVKVTAAAAPKAATPLIVLFNDSTGATTTFLVRAAAAAGAGGGVAPAPAASGAGSGSPAPTPPPVTSPPVVPDARLKKVQDELAARHVDAGGTDGVWTPAVRAAVVAFLRSNIDPNVPGPDPDSLQNAQLLTAAEFALGLSTQ